MANFDRAFDHTMVIEGGYVNNPNDTGGETYKGISRKNWSKWTGWKIVDETKKTSPKTIQELNRALYMPLIAHVKAFYKTNFWDINKLDQIATHEIAEELFDTGVNMGTGIAARMLQEALNLCNKNGQSYPDLAVDGKIGQITLSTLNTKANQVVVLKTLNLLQGERYLNIMRNNKSQEIFWAGWLKRVLIAQ